MENFIFCAVFNDSVTALEFKWDIRDLVAVFRICSFYGEDQKYLPEVFYKKAVLKNLAIFTRKHLRQRFFLIKLPIWRPSKEDSNRCFPVNIAKFLRIPIVKNICERHTKIFLHFNPEVKEGSQ